jgi:RHS repeat-associated protein
VTEITDHTGASAATYRYDAFGNTLVATGSYAATNRYRFSTKPLDNEIANAPLYYYAYRWYDPVTGRWPSRDPIGENGGVNLYGFVGNNGVNHIDLLGLDSLGMKIYAEALERVQNVVISPFGGSFANIFGSTVTFSDDDNVISTDREVRGELDAYYQERCRAQHSGTIGKVEKITLHHGEVLPHLALTHTQGLNESKFWLGQTVSAEVTRGSFDCCYFGKHLSSVITDISISYVWKDTIDANLSGARSAQSVGSAVWLVGEALYWATSQAVNITFDVEVDFTDHRR